MPVQILASFPNSRIKPRPSTQNANTYQVPLFDYVSFGPALIAPPNANRTYINLRNQHPSVGLWYVYATPVTVDPTLVPTDGITNQCAILITMVSTTLYQKQDDGVTTNWIIVGINDVGSLLPAQQLVSLSEVQGYLYGSANSNVPVAPQVVVDVDEGRG